MVKGHIELVFQCFQFWYVYKYIIKGQNYLSDIQTN